MDRSRSPNRNADAAQKPVDGQLMQGTVKSYSGSWGFILTPSLQRDVYFKYEQRGAMSLAKGMAVSFVLKVMPDGNLQARSLTIIDASSAVEEPPTNRGAGPWVQATKPPSSPASQSLQNDSVDAVESKFLDWESLGRQTAHAASYASQDQPAVSAVDSGARDAPLSTLDVNQIASMQVLQAMGLQVPQMPQALGQASATALGPVVTSPPVAPVVPALPTMPASGAQMHQMPQIPAVPQISPQVTQMPQVPQISAAPQVQLASTQMSAGQETSSVSIPQVQVPQISQLAQLPQLAHMPQMPQMPQITFQIPQVSQMPQMPQALHSTEPTAKLKVASASVQVPENRTSKLIDGERMYGIVKNYDKLKSYGFVNIAGNNKDIYFNKKDSKDLNNGSLEPTQGMIVQFVLRMMHDAKPQAHHVREWKAPPAETKDENSAAEDSAVDGMNFAQYQMQMTQAYMMQYQQAQASAWAQYQASAAAQYQAGIAAAAAEHYKAAVSSTSQDAVEPKGD